MVLAAAGNLEHDRLGELAERLFAELPARCAVEAEPARYAGGDRREARDLEQLHIILGFPGPCLEEPDFFTASVLSTAFGGGMSSRLFQEIRENRGLVYAIHSFVHSYRDGGLFGIYAGTGEDEAAELVPVLCGEIVRLAEGLGAVELARAKAQMKAGLLMSLESTSARCEQLAQHLLIHGTPFDPAAAVRRIEAVDAEAIGRVVARWHTAPPTLVALGPLSGLEPFDRVASRLAA
jgi:predicted Zn-dependent peptidase